MACGNNKATRNMVVSVGGLIGVSAAVSSAPSKQDALRQLVSRKAGPEALSSARVSRDLAERRDHYVLPNGERQERTNKEGRRSHVHVVKAIDLDPKTVLVQQTERAGKKTFRREGVLFLQRPSEERVREAERALARSLRRPGKSGRG
jgi:hypothetical protein